MQILTPNLRTIRYIGEDERKLWEAGLPEVPVITHGAIIVVSVPTAAILCARKDFEYLSSNKSAIIEIQDETTTVPPKQATVEKNIVGKTLEAIKTAVGDKL